MGDNITIGVRYGAEGVRREVIIFLNLRIPLNFEF
jgi:hypothetical protein